MSTFHNAQRKGFTKGGGTYTCRTCKRLTRPTGTGDNDSVSLCFDCYELAGQENSLSDNGRLDDPHCVLGHIAHLLGLGADISGWADLEQAAIKQIKEPT